MPSNFLLLLPLVGGYLFNHGFYKLRFRAQALTGHRLILEAAVSGLAFLAVARLFVALLLPLIVPKSVLAEWSVISGRTPFSGTSVLGVLLAPLSALAANLCVGYKHRDEVAEEKYAHKPRWLRDVYRWRQASRDFYLDKAIRRSGNALQKLLHQVATRGKSGISVGVTMANGKIYACEVTTSPNLSPTDEYVSVLPLLSGHRDRDTQQIIYDLAYPIAKFQELAAINQVVVALPVSEIKSAHMLDEEYYESEVERLKEAAEKAKLSPTKMPSRRTQ